MNYYFDVLKKYYVKPIMYSPILDMSTIIFHKKAPSKRGRENYL